MTWHISVSEFAAIKQAVIDAGYGADISWSEGITAPESSDAFAREAIFVICNSGMKHTIACVIFDKVMDAVGRGQSARSVFGHPGKATAIDEIWHGRDTWFDRWMLEPATIEQQLALCQELPWIGEITKYHLAKNLGADVAKPDVHLQRLADASSETVQGLCERLAAETGLRCATVDVILWRACAIGVVNSRELQEAA